MEEELRKQPALPSDSWSRASDSAPNHAMMRLARGSQCMTQSDLAKRMKVSQTKVSKWEDGLLAPAAEDIRRVSHILQYPIEFFYQRDAVHPFGTCCLYHRKRKSLSTKALNTIHDRINILRIGVERLLRNIEPMECKFDRLDIDEFDSPEQIARLVRHRMQLPFGPISNLVSAVEAAGGIVLMHSFGTDKIDAVSQWTLNGPPLFFVNVDIPVDRWRWTLAHEVGHIVMHHIPSPNAEEEADRFASEFLMPERDVKLDLNRIDVKKALRLKPRWRVSMQALIRRAKDVGCISQDRYRSLYAYLSKIGYRKTEPNPLSPELPTTLKRIFDLHQGNLGYSEQEIANLMYCLSADQMIRRYLPHESSGRFRVVG